MSCCGFILNSFFSLLKHFKIQAHQREPKWPIIVAKNDNRNKCGYLCFIFLVFAYTFWSAEKTRTAATNSVIFKKSSTKHPIWCCFFYGRTFLASLTNRLQFILFGQPNHVHIHFGTLNESGFLMGNRHSFFQTSCHTVGCRARAFSAKHQAASTTNKRPFKF